MPSVNPGPATTQTISTEAVIAPQTFPNFNSSGQGTNAYRLLAVGRAIPVNGVGDAAFMPLINTNNFDFLPAASAVVFANPLALVNGILVQTSIASTTVRLASGPNGTGQVIVAATALATLSATTAATCIQVIPSTALGYYSTSTWGVGQVNGQGGASSFGIYCGITVASGVANSQVDCFVYGTDLT